MNANKLQQFTWVDKMTLQKLTVIQGGRDEIEADLAKALFGVDDAEIARCLERLNSLQIKRPKPKLVKNKASQPVKD